MRLVAKNSVLAGAALVLAAISCSPASATVVASESFENPTLSAPPAIQYGPDEFAFNTNAVGPVLIADFTFSGFSGIIKNGSLGVFPDTTFGTQAAFLQTYQNSGSDILWLLTGLTPGSQYELSFSDVGSPNYPTEPFSVTACGGAAVNYAPGSSYALETQKFTATSSSCGIDFAATVLASNQVAAIDNLSVSTVPEPLTLSFFGAGLAGTWFVRRRRKTA